MAVKMGKPALPGLLQLTPGVFSLTRFTRARIALELSPDASSLMGESQLYRLDISGLELSVHRDGGWGTYKAVTDRHIHSETEYFFHTKTTMYVVSETRSGEIYLHKSKFISATFEELSCREKL